MYRNLTIWNQSFTYYIQVISVHHTCLAFIPYPICVFTIWATLACRACLINSKFHTLNQHIGVLSKKNYSNLGWHFTYTSLFSLYNTLGSIFLNISSCTYFPWHSAEDIISPVMTPSLRRWSCCIMLTRQFESSFMLKSVISTISWGN